MLSLYTLKVHRSLSTPDYKPACDLNRRVSCSKAFKSRYSKLLWFHNAEVGLLFYALVFLAALTSSDIVLQVLVGLGVLATLLLAWLSYVRMRKLCIVCTSIYVINVLLLLATVL